MVIIIIKCKVIKIAAVCQHVSHILLFKQYEPIKCRQINGQKIKTERAAVQWIKCRMIMSNDRAFDGHAITTHWARQRRALKAAEHGTPAVPSRRTPWARARPETCWSTCNRRCIYTDRTCDILGDCKHSQKNSLVSGSLRGRWKCWTWKWRTWNCRTWNCRTWKCRTWNSRT